MIDESPNASKPATEKVGCDPSHDSGEFPRIDRVEPPLPACFGAEPFLLSARHDLMVEADKLSDRLRATDGLLDSVATVTKACDAGAAFIDKLAAYLKGGDERLIEAGMRYQAQTTRLRLTEEDVEDLRATVNSQANEINGLRDDVRHAESAYEREVERTAELRKLIGDASPAVKLVERLACMTDTEIDFEGAGQIRVMARAALNGQAFTVSPLYSEEDRNRAIDAVARRFPGAVAKGFVVDEVATALGMRRAGA